jgi:hypothetical protein
VPSACNQSIMIRRIERLTLIQLVLFLSAMIAMSFQPYSHVRTVRVNRFVKSTFCNISKLSLRCSEATTRPMVSATDSELNLCPALDVKDVVQLFSRLADKEILLDIPGAGSPEIANCCHSGCDSCNYSRVFDQMTSGRPKWIPLYSYREFIDGRSHTPSWISLFKDGENTGTIRRDNFSTRLNTLPVQLTMGTPSDADSSVLISADVAEAFWRKLKSYTETPFTEELSAEEFASYLSKMTGESHGAAYSSFAASFL